MHSFTVLEARGGKPRCWQGCTPFRESFLATSSFWLGWHSCCFLSCRYILPILASVFTWPSPLCVCASMSKFLSSYKHTTHIVFRAHPRASLVAQLVKNPPAMQETPVRSPGREEPLEEGMATHSSILAWRIPGTEEAGGLQAIRWLRVRHD